MDDQLTPGDFQHGNTDSYCDLKRGIHEAPADRVLLQELLSNGQFEDRQAVLAQIQMESPSLIPSVVAELSEMEAFRALCTSLLEKCYNSQNPSIFKELQIWMRSAVAMKFPHLAPNSIPKRHGFFPPTRLAADLR